MSDPIEKQKEEKQINEKVAADLLAYYSRQISAHVGPVVTLFFALIALLALIRNGPTAVPFFSKVVLSIVYFAFGFLAGYFYWRLMYFGKLADAALSHPFFSSTHEGYRAKVMKQSKVLSIVARLSEKEKEGYRLDWSWTMVLAAAAVAITCWAIIFFNLL
jgi:hypothetical protein